MAQGIVGADLQLEMRSYVASLSTSSTTSLSSEANSVSGLQLQKSIRCPICLMKFKDPRRLPCEHTFCKECLQAVLKRQRQEKTQLNCLICQEPVHLDKGVDELDTAIFVNTVEEIYRRSPQQVAGPATGLPSSVVKCSKCDGSYCSCCIHVVCSKCNKYISTMHCEQCNASVCGRCAARDHLQHQHSVIEIEQVHQMIKQSMATTYDEEEEMNEVWERESSGSSKDSGGEASQFYTVNTGDMSHSDTEEGAWERDSGSSRDSGGNVNQFYTVTAVGDLSHIAHTDEDDNGESGSSKDSDGEVAQVYTITHDDESDQSELEEEREERVEIHHIDANLSYHHIATPLHAVTTTAESSEEERLLPNMAVNVVVEERDISDEEETLDSNEDHSGVEDNQSGRPPTMIDDADELSDIVNETVQNIDPSQLRRLKPSAPSNVKRMSRIQLRQPVAVAEYDGPPRYREIRSLKWCSRITLGFVIVLTLCTLAFGGLAVTAFFLSPRDTKVYVLERELVLMAKLSPFWTRDLTVTSINSYDALYYFETDLYQVNCNRLVTTTAQYTVVRTGTQPALANDLTIDVPIAVNGSNTYFLAGSRIDFNISITSDTTYRQCTSELNVYDDYDNFLAENGLTAIQTNCVGVRKPSAATQEPWTLVSFSPMKDSFYFVTLSVPPSSTYSISVEVTKLGFTNSSIIYTERCAIVSTVDRLIDECKFTLLTTSIAIGFDETCILATTSARQPATRPASIVKMSLSSSPNIFRNVGYVVTPGPLLLYLVACLMVWICYRSCLICCYKCKRRRMSSREFATALI